MEWNVSHFPHSYIRSNIISLKILWFFYLSKCFCIKFMLSVNKLTNEDILIKMSCTKVGSF